MPSNTHPDDLDRKDAIVTATSTADVEAQHHRLVPTLTGGTGLEKNLTMTPDAQRPGSGKGDQSPSTALTSEAEAKGPARPPAPPFPTAFGVFCLASCGTVSSFLLMGWTDMNFNKGFALGAMYFYVGGVGMAIAGIFEMIGGNALAFCVFMAYSSYWAANGALFNGSWGLLASAQADQWAGQGQVYLSKGIGYFQLMYVLITFILWVVCLFTNIVFASIFTFIWPTLVCLAIAGLNPGWSQESIDRINKVGGAFAFVAICFAWYACLSLLLLGMPNAPRLPLGDLQPFWERRLRKKMEHAKSVKMA